jgi:hypothetical protein
MAMQMKEARERCESLEELAGVHRLETMRRLLNDIKNRANTKVREFKERMGAANEEWKRKQILWGGARRAQDQDPRGREGAPTG